MSIQEVPKAIPSGYVGDTPFEERNRIQKTLANLAGIRLYPTLVPAGESLLPVGEENKRKLQASIGELPTLQDGLAALRHRVVDQEKPVDTEIALSEVRMEKERGGLRRGASGAYVTDAHNFNLGYTSSGFGHICQFIKPASIRMGIKDTLLALPPPIRADAFNYFAENCHRQDEDAVILRTIRAHETARRVVRAVTSKRHSLETGDDMAVAEAMNVGIPDGAKVRITREPDFSSFELIWPALEREIRVGDIALVALEVENSETKAGGLRVRAKLLQVRCWNFTVAWAADDEPELSIRHVGDLRVRLPQAFKRALEKIEPFVLSFGDAYKTPFPEFAKTRGELLKRAGKALELTQSTLDDAQRVWDIDGAGSAGDTLAGLANALTRSAQEMAMAQASEVEAKAGRLISVGWAALM